MFFGIIDARHSCDSRFWEHVLPAFYLLNGDADERVSFDPEICLVQLPHSYIGTKADTDPLDIRNDFLFSGSTSIAANARDACDCPDLPTGPSPHHPAHASVAEPSARASLLLLQWPSFATALMG